MVASTRPSSKKSKKRVSFIGGLDDSSQDGGKCKLHSPPPERKIMMEEGGIGGIGERFALFREGIAERKEGDVIRNPFEKDCQSQASQAPVWAYGEAFREADGLLRGGMVRTMSPMKKEAAEESRTSVEGAFDMQKFLMEGDTTFEMPMEEYWDADIAASGRL